MAEGERAPEEERPWAAAATEPSTVAAHQRALIGGAPELTMRDLADRAGVPVPAARMFWRAMGFPDVPDDTVMFTAADVAALRQIARLVGRDVVDLSTAVSLVRAQSHTTDRLALWQTEALVEDAARRLQLDDTGARLVVLDRLADIGAVLEDQLVYAWRRQLAALAARIESEVARRPVDDGDDDILPLPRALGFADMVSFTRRSADLGSHALAELVQGFEFAARDVITSHGARVVKTIGDAVLFIADELPTAADVAIDLIAEIDARPELLPVRASLVWGRVVSRSGDVFGPTVNLASRIVDVAPPRMVVMDAATAELLATGPGAARFAVLPRAEADMPGIGTVPLRELRRAEAAHP